MGDLTRGPRGAPSRTTAAADGLQRPLLSLPLSARLSASVSQPHSQLPRMRDGNPLLAYVFWHWKQAEFTLQTTNTVSSPPMPR